jgi:cytochrome b561
MAAMVLTMLSIGVAMVASLAAYHVLVSIHRPLGIAILILVVVCFVNRLVNTILAYLFFLMFLAHFGAVLYHALIVRDGLLKRMAPWNVRSEETNSR